MPPCTLQEPPAWPWSAFCPVRLAFLAKASEEATFDCETSPSSPCSAPARECSSFEAPFGGDRARRRPDRSSPPARSPGYPSHRPAPGWRAARSGSGCREGIRGGLVGLRDVTVVALAQDADGDAAVRRLLLLRRRQRSSILIVLRRLPDGLDAAPAPAGVRRPGSGRPSARSLTFAAVASEEAMFDCSTEPGHRG